MNNLIEQAANRLLPILTGTKVNKDIYLQECMKIELTEFASAITKCIESKLECELAYIKTVILVEVSVPVIPVM